MAAHGKDPLANYRYKPCIKLDVFFLFTGIFVKNKFLKFGGPISRALFTREGRGWGVAGQLLLPQRTEMMKNTFPEVAPF